MARRLAFAALLLTVAHATVAYADEDLGTGDQTGVNDSETGEHVVPEVQAVTSPSPQPVDQPDLTEVASPQLTIPHYRTWLRLVGCEAGGDWHSASNRTYKGGLQFDASTWARHGGLNYAWRADYATPEEQMLVAERTLASQGWSAWPACSRRLGLR